MPDTSERCLDPNTAKSKKAKGAWAAAVTSGAIQAVKAFNPVASLPTLNPTTLGGSPEFYGVITPSQQMFTLLLVISGKLNTDPRKIVDLLRGNTTLAPTFL